VVSTAADAAQGGAGGMELAPPPLPGLPACNNADELMPEYQHQQLPGMQQGAQEVEGAGASGLVMDPSGM
jgi:hypothetical protein